MSAAQPSATGTSSDNVKKPEFSIQRIYLKDVSFESPNTPTIFLDEWKPDVNIQLDNESIVLDADNHTYHVLLQVTVTVKYQDKTVFLVEVKQAGIFTLKDFQNAQIQPVLGSYCPNILYPYARETISNLCVQGGFPALYLSHINFDAIYAERLEREKRQAAEAKASSSSSVN